MKKNGVPPPQTVRFLAVGVHNGFEPVAVQILREPRRVQAQLFRLGNQILTRQLVLASESASCISQNLPCRLPQARLRAQGAIPCVLTADSVYTNLIVVG